MDNYYHVQWEEHHTIEVGVPITLKPLGVHNDAANRAYWDELASQWNARGGVTAWGGKVLMCVSTVIIWQREMFFEDVRSASYPDRPSRLQVLFAIRSLNDALEVLRKTSIVRTATVWEVTTDQPTFHADMNWVTNNPYEWPVHAHRYWQQEQTERPFGECILLPPVYPLRTIELDGDHDGGNIEDDAE